MRLILPAQADRALTGGGKELVWGDRETVGGLFCLGSTPFLEEKCMEYDSMCDLLLNYFGSIYCQFDLSFFLKASNVAR